VGGWGVGVCVLVSRRFLGVLPPTALGSNLGAQVTGSLLGGLTTHSPT